MIAIGDTIKWRTVNGHATGEVVRPLRKGEWMVRLPSGKSTIVTESSAKKL